MTVLNEDMTKLNVSRAQARREDRADAPGARAAADLARSGALDGLFAQIESGQIDLMGDGGFIPGLIKASLERGLQVELADHLGYDKGDPAASEFENSRNGTTPKTVASTVGAVDLDVPRDRLGTFVPQLAPLPRGDLVTDLVGDLADGLR